MKLNSENIRYNTYKKLIFLFIHEDKTTNFKKEKKKIRG
jgi:hypothetical protein